MICETPCTYTFSGGQLPNAGVQQQPQVGVLQPQVQEQGQFQAQDQSQQQQGLVQGQYNATTNPPMKFTTIPTPSTGLKVVEPSGRRSRFEERSAVDKQQTRADTQQAEQHRGQPGVGWREQGEATTQVVPHRGEHGPREVAKERDDRMQHAGHSGGQQHLEGGHQPDVHGHQAHQHHNVGQQSEVNGVGAQPPAPAGVKQGALPQPEQAGTRRDQPENPEHGLSQSEKARQDKFREYIGDKQKRLDRPQGQGHAPGEGRAPVPLQYGEPGRFGHYPDRQGDAAGQRQGPEYRPPGGKYAN